MTNRTPLVVGNWKMNHGIAATVDFLSAFSQKSFKGVDTGIAPPFTSLGVAAQTCREKRINGLLLFSQNIAWAPSGAFTGETSAAMLKEAGCQGCLVGHSERRQYFGETDKTVNQRLRQGLTEGLLAILCIGETLEQRDTGVTKATVTGQLSKALEGIDPGSFGRLAIAYEPVWAIGTGRTATPEQAEEVHQWIRSHLWDSVSKTVAEQMRILYGGSVNPGNSRALFEKPNIDGFLVGGASLKCPDFVDIIQACHS